MESKKDIGKALREKLDLLDKNPSDAVWENVNTDLKERRKKRFVFYFLTAAALLTLITISFFTFSNKTQGNSNTINKNTTDEPNTQQLLNTEQHLDAKTDTIFKNQNIRKSKTTTSKKLVLSADEIDEYEIVTRNKVSVKKSKTQIVTKQKTIKNSKEKNSNSATIHKSSPVKKSVQKKTATPVNRKTTASKTNIKSAAAKSNSKKTAAGIYGKNSKKDHRGVVNKTIPNRYPISETSNIPETENSGFGQSISSIALKQDSIQVAADSLKTTIDSIPVKKKRILKPKSETVLQEDSKNDKLHISIFAGPMYYNSLSKKSPLIKNGSDFDKTGSLNLTYGIFLRSMFTETIGLRVGIFRTTAKLTTTVTNTGEQQFVLGQTAIKLNDNFDKVTFNSHFSGASMIDLVQKTAYFEIPVEAYLVLSNENKIGIDAFAGFSTYFMTKDQVSAEAKNINSIDIGTSETMKKVSFGLNIGTTFHYKLNERFRVEAMPIFKYQMKAAPDFNPVMLSLQFGITYGL